MNEDVEMSARADLYLLVDQAHAVLLQPLDRSGQVIHLQADVVQSFAALVEETGDRRIIAGRLQQLDAAVATGTMARRTFSCATSSSGSTRMPSCS